MNDEQQISNGIFATITSILLNNSTVITYTILIQICSFILSENYNFTSKDFINPILATIASLYIYQLVFKKLFDKIKKSHGMKYNEEEDFSVYHI